MPANPVRSVLVFGSGLMGCAIAKTFARTGFDTTVYKLPDVPIGPVADGVKVTERIEGTPDLIIEAVPENMDLKIAVYKQLEDAFPAETVMASNTSGLPLDKLSAGMRHPERFMGAHYFMPADVCPMVEVTRVDQTTDDAVARTKDALERSGKDVVVVNKPIAGFLINRIQHALMHEVWHLIETGIATPEDIDRVGRKLLGPRMCINGMVEQKDLSGLHPHANAQLTICPHLSPVTAESQMLKDKLARGETGIRAGKGFYDWTGKDADKEIATANDKLDRLLAFLDKL